MQFNIIGAGRLGKNLALAIQNASLGTLKAIYNKNFNSAQMAVDSIGSGRAIKNLLDLPPADLLFITTPDDALAEIITSLAEAKIIAPGSIVVHCSGVLSSEVLQPLKEQGCHTASIHPAKSFAQAYLSANAFSGVNCIVEGDPVAIKWLESCFQQLGAQIIPISPEHKITYHAACVIASNYLITLASCSKTLLIKSGLSKSQAALIIQGLMQSSLNNLQEEPDEVQVLTGPLVRGDYKTISLHIQAMQDHPVITKLYKAAGLATLPLTDLEELQMHNLRNILMD